MRLKGVTLRLACPNSDGTADTTATRPPTKHAASTGAMASISLASLSRVALACPNLVPAGPLHFHGDLVPAARVDAARRVSKHVARAELPERVEKRRPDFRIR